MSAVFVATRRVFDGRMWPRLLRGALMSLRYGLVLVLAVSGVGLWTVLF